MSRSHRTHRQWWAILVVIASIVGATSGSAQTVPQGPSAPGPNQDVARRHLTAARNLLSDVTELPAAAQLTGDTRLQVQRLIGDFNELIATGSNWRESYAKVESGLDSLLKQQASPAGPGSSGTSGTAASLDATIRGKLVEFSSELDRFEAAASGSAPAGRASAQPAQQVRAMSQELVHIEAIEVILDAQARAQKAATMAAGGAITSSQTASGSTRTTITNPDVTLSAGQLEQIKAHLAELRRLVDRK